MTCRFDEQCNRITFMGRVWERPLSEWPSSLREVKFPVEAFKDFLRAEGLPMPDFWQDSPSTALKSAPAARPVTAAPSQQDECREVEPAPVAAAPSVAPDAVGCSADLSAAIDYGAATRDVLNVLADYLKRPPERRKSGNPAFPTEAQCVLDALDVKAKRKGWGTGDDGRLSQAQWIGVRLLFLPPTENKGCKGSRWGGNTDRDPKK